MGQSFLWAVPCLHLTGRKSGDLVTGHLWDERQSSAPSTMLEFDSIARFDIFSFGLDESELYSYDQEVVIMLWLMLIQTQIQQQLF